MDSELSKAKHLAEVEIAPESFGTYFSFVHSSKVSISMTPEQGQLILSHASPEGLTSLVGFWRKTRSPAVAKVIEQVSEQLAGPLKAKTSSDVHIFQREWIQIAQAPDAMQVVGLLDTLTNKLPQLPLSGDETFFAARVQALHRLGPDCRVAQKLVSLVLSGRYQVADENRFVTLFGSPVQLGVDARQANRLKQALLFPSSKIESVRRFQATYFQKLIESCEAHRSRLEPSIESAWHQLVDVAPALAPSAVEEALLAEVYRHPENDTAKQIYADALLERHQPRGEFISLQLLDRPSVEAEKRVRVLLNAHEHVWLGPLALVLRNTYFKRGFLHSAELERQAVADGDTWIAAAQHEALSTLTSFKKGYGNDAHFLMFLQSKHTRHVQEIDVSSGRILSALLGLFRPRLDTLNFTFRPGLQTLKELEPAPLVRQLKSISFLQVTPKLIESLAPTALAERVRHFEFTLPFGLGTPALVVSILKHFLGRGAVRRVSFRSVGGAFASLQVREPGSVFIEAAEDGARLLTQVLPALEPFVQVAGHVRIRHFHQGSGERGEDAMRNEQVRWVTQWATANIQLEWTTSNEAEGLRRAIFQQVRLE
jgi:uncharacterized protein (TIGR02996 family)